MSSSSSHRILGSAVFLLAVLSGGCRSSSSDDARPALAAGDSYAFLTEIGKENKSMEPGLNRRVLNTITAKAGNDILLREDGSFQVQPGTYRISGYSLIVHEAAGGAESTGQPAPGYCLVYEKRYENDRAALTRNAVAIGTPSMATSMGPSLFDTIATFEEEITLCVGHQSGQNVTDLYLAYIDGDPQGPSATRRLAQVALVRLHD